MLPRRAYLHQAAYNGMRRWRIPSAESAPGSLSGQERPFASYWATVSSAREQTCARAHLRSELTTARRDARIERSAIEIEVMRVLVLHERTR
jgi:hypothetical protein